VIGWTAEGCPQPAAWFESLWGAIRLLPYPRVQDTGSEPVHICVLTAEAQLPAV